MENGSFKKYVITMFETNSIFQIKSEMQKQK